MRLGFIAMAALLITACSKAPSTEELQFSPNVDSAAKKIVQDAWPKVVEACPGITAYGDDLVFKPTSDNYNLDVIFEIPHGVLPARYMADGHTCYLGISHDGKTLQIAKDACKAACLGRSVQPDEMEDDLYINL